MSFFLQYNVRFLLEIYVEISFACHVFSGEGDDRAHSGSGRRGETMGPDFAHRGVSVSSGTLCHPGRHTVFIVEHLYRKLFSDVIILDSVLFLSTKSTFDLVD